MPYFVVIYQASEHRDNIRWHVVDTRNLKHKVVETYASEYRARSRAACLCFEKELEEIHSPVSWWPTLSADCLALILNSQVDLVVEPGSPKIDTAVL